MPTRANIIWIDKAQSTNAFAAQMPDDATPHGTVVATHTQTAGRGQRGNAWEASPGQNLTFSMVLRPRNIAVARQFDMSMAVALGIRDGLSGILPSDDLKIKWSNDIYWRDGKLCGILIENAVSGTHIGRAIAGIGINVNQTAFVSDAPNPVSLAQITGRHFDLKHLLQTVADAVLVRTDSLDARLGQGNSTCDGTCDKTFLDQYLSVLWRNDNAPHLWLHRQTGRTVQGTIAGIGPWGHLVLRFDDGRTAAYAFGQITPVL